MADGGIVRLAMQKSILVVEDDIDIRESLAYLLADEGYEVACAGDGREALSYLHDGHTPSLILLDIMMPGMDGLAFREAQQQEPALAAIPVVALSASSSLAHRAKSMGAAAALQKPFHVEQLVKVIEQVS
jgi:CheY-like chemotaxis protein